MYNREISKFSVPAVELKQFTLEQDVLDSLWVYIRDNFTQWVNLAPVNKKVYPFSQKQIRKPEDPYITTNFQSVKNCFMFLSDQKSSGLKIVNINCTRFNCR